MWVVKLEPNVISHNAGISACEKGKQWQWALALLSEMWEAKLEPNAIISYIAATCACERCGQWRHALSLLSDMRECNVETSEVSYSLCITAYERSSRNSAGFPGYLVIGLSRFRVSCEALCVWEPAGQPL
ncbi:unnamed protein product [Prorocentrum cordatum]|uniref:Pentatricopeptide repeat-containing protein n=1 Tax=Prorocentrum cordatum TaxID=2364126 RepID=A0ABN9S025_9DINO|nr:unnamed protein product [Polarella glacialis]